MCYKNVGIKLILTKWQIIINKTKITILFKCLSIPSKIIFSIIFTLNLCPKMNN